jgi:hypothetical protein
MPVPHLSCASRAALSLLPRDGVRRTIAFAPYLHPSACYRLALLGSRFLTCAQLRVAARKWNPKSDPGFMADVKTRLEYVPPPAN